MLDHARRLFVLATLTPTLAFAQPANTAPAEEAATRIDGATTKPNDPNNVRIDLQIDGGSLPDYVDYLARASGGNFILLNDPAVNPAEIRMPPMRLKQIPLSTALNLLTQLPGTNITVESTGDEPNPTWSIVAHSPYTAEGTVELPPTVGTKLFPLERLLFGSAGITHTQDPEDVRRLAERVDQTLQLIDLTLSVLAAGGERAQINLHKSTNTLVVKGTPAQLDAVAEAIAALGPDRSQQAIDRENAQRWYAERLEEVTRQSQRTQEELTDQLARARKSLDNVQARRDQAVREAETMARQLHERQSIEKPTTQP